jgi:hypothetical protein
MRKSASAVVSSGEFSFPLRLTLDGARAKNRASLDSGFERAKNKAERMTTNQIARDDRPSAGRSLSRSQTIWR